MALKSVVLLIIDGFGLPKNASEYEQVLNKADMPNWQYLIKKYPTSALDCSGLSVGLPSGQIGNSEVGHITIGTGRKIEQKLSMINRIIANNKLNNNKVINNLSQQVAINNGSLHLIGLLSEGGVHSHQQHCFALCKLLQNFNLKKIYLHLISDGRDCLPNSFRNSVKTLLKEIKDFKNIELASLIGRYYAMDRDRRWQRTKYAYDLMVNAKADFKANDVNKAIDQLENAGLTDEFYKSVVIGNYKGMIAGDGVIIYNFRPDRVKQISDALAGNLGQVFEKHLKQNVTFASPNLSGLVVFTEFANSKEDDFIKSAFKKNKLNDTLGEMIAENKCTQLRLAETEKFPHVTYFFDGGFKLELFAKKEILIDSPKVASYDKQPEMSLKEVNKILCDSIGKYDVIICNFANPDMVGHTGNLDAVLSALRVVDDALGKLYKKIIENQGEILIISDHGNCEKMIDESGEVHTAHTLNKVPCVYIGKQNKKLSNGSLIDVAPTILDLLKIKKSSLMEGNSLLVNE